MWGWKVHELTDANVTQANGKSARFSEHCVHLRLNLVALVSTRVVHRAVLRVVWLWYTPPPPRKAGAVRCRPVPSGAVRCRPVLGMPNTVISYQEH